MGHGGWRNDPEYAAGKLVKGGSGLITARPGAIARV